MIASMPLFDSSELDTIRRQREELLKRLRKGGVDAHTRILREQKLSVLTVRQVLLERKLGIGQP